MKNKELKRYLREERRELRKGRGCYNCRFRVWTERPRSYNPCAGCVYGNGIFGHWKKRRIWQRVRDLIKFKFIF